MAIARSVTQAPSFIDDLAKDYGTQLAGLTAELDTSRFDRALLQHIHYNNKQLHSQDNQ